MDKFCGIDVNTIIIWRKCWDESFFRDINFAETYVPQEAAILLKHNVLDILNRCSIFYLAPQETLGESIRKDTQIKTLQVDLYFMIVVHNSYNYSP